MFTMTDRATFQIAYDGEALREHRIDVRDLAPALLSLSDLVSVAGKVTGGSDTRTTVNVRTTAPGSFLISFELVQVVDTVVRVTTFFAGDGVSGALNILAVLGLVGSGATGAIAGAIRAKKWLQGRRAIKVERVATDALPAGMPPSTQVLQITREDGAQLTVYGDALAILESDVATKAIEGLMRPLQSPGIDTFASGMQLTPGDLSKADLIIEEQDLPFMQAMPDEYIETLSDSTTAIVVSIVQPSFREDLMWKVSLGDAGYRVRMLDADFVRDVSEGRRAFSAKDLLRVEMRAHQYRTKSGGLRTEYEILRVLEHIPPRPSTQFPLFPDEAT